MEGYQRFLTKGSKPFNPLELAKETEDIVIKDDARKYTAFYCTGVYGGISTGYTVGCCLRCIFCWASPSRDFPEKYGFSVSPEEAYNRLMNNAIKRRVKRVRISGGEPTLGKNHLIALLEHLRKRDMLFILETNGILLGADDSYVDELRRFSNIHIRLCIKAGTQEGFESRTGAKGKFYKLPFIAVKKLIKTKLNFHVAAMTDERIMPKEERLKMLEELSNAGYDDWLEEEICDPYDMTIKRLQSVGREI